MLKFRWHFPFLYFGLATLNVSAKINFRQLSVIFFQWFSWLMRVWFLCMSWFCDYLVLSCPLLLQRLARQVQDLSKLPAKVMMSSSFQMWTCPPLLQPNQLKVNFCSTRTKTKNTAIGHSCTKMACTFYKVRPLVSWYWRIMDQKTPPSSSKYYIW